MFDIGWPELMVIGVLTIIVVGPKELPRVLRTVTGIIRKIRMMAGDFQNSIEDIAREADMQDIKKQLEEAGKRDIGKDVEEYLDPTGDLNKSVKEMETDMQSWADKANLEKDGKSSETPSAELPSVEEASSEPASAPEDTKKQAES